MSSKISQDTLPNRRAAGIEASFERMGWKWSRTYVSSEVCGERDLRGCGLKEIVQSSYFGSRAGRRGSSPLQFGHLPASGPQALPLAKGAFVGTDHRVPGIHR